MKKKFGFTLAEVLITLGIIGVVAALTTPALVKNSGQAKIGPSLAKFVNTFETAAEQLKTDNEVRTLIAATSEDSWGSGKSALLQEMSKYMVMTPVPLEDARNYKVYSPDGTNSDSVDTSNFYQLKDGSTIARTSYFGSISYSATGTYSGAEGVLLYDINGTAGNNRAGKEVFAFVVDVSGILIPYGGNTYYYLKSSETKTNCNLNSDTLKEGFACTGKIADNNWKAEY